MHFAALYDHIVNLDMALTGKDLQAAAHNARNQANILENVVRFIDFKDCYYLSDSGYSRVYMTKDGGIQLTQNSLDTVKAKWETTEGRVAAERFQTAVMALYAKATDLSNRDVA